MSSESGRRPEFASAGLAVAAVLVCVIAGAVYVFLRHDPIDQEALRGSVALPAPSSDGITIDGVTVQRQAIALAAPEIETIRSPEGPEAAPEIQDSGEPVARPIPAPHAVTTAEAEVAVQPRPQTATEPAGDVLSGPSSPPAEAPWMTPPAQLPLPASLAEAVTARTVSPPSQVAAASIEEETAATAVDGGWLTPRRETPVPDLSGGSTPTVAPEGERLVQQSPPSPQIEAIQRALANAGLNPGPVDGVLGPRTVEAVRSFQRSIGETPDGVVDDALLARLTAVGPAPGYGTVSAANSAMGQTAPVSQRNAVPLGAPIRLTNDDVTRSTEVGNQSVTALGAASPTLAPPTMLRPAESGETAIEPVDEFAARVRQSLGLSGTIAGEPDSEARVREAGSAGIGGRPGKVAEAAETGLGGGVAVAADDAGTSVADAGAPGGGTARGAAADSGATGGAATGGEAAGGAAPRR